MGSYSCIRIWNILTNLIQAASSSVSKGYRIPVSCIRVFYTLLQLLLYKIQWSRATGVVLQLAIHNPSITCPDAGYFILAATAPGQKLDLFLFFQRLHRHTVYLQGDVFIDAVQVIAILPRFRDKVAVNAVYFSSHCIICAQV